MTDNLIIIFVKNPVLGKVKTRLAASIGPEKALEVYNLLLDRTLTVMELIPYDKIIYYSDYVDKEDIWDNTIYQKELQQGDDLGARMYHAFEKGFEKGYKHICLIGSDCYELSDEVVEEAFEKLQVTELVIGPCLDGGYYLLGLKKLIPEYFQNKKWSTDTVLLETLQNAKDIKMPFALLPTLTDVDDEKDLISIDELDWD